MKGNPYRPTHLIVSLTIVIRDDLMLEEIAHLCDAHFKPYDPAFSPHKSNLFVHTHTHTHIHSAFPGG